MKRLQGFLFMMFTWVTLSAQVFNPFVYPVGQPANVPFGVVSAPVSGASYIIPALPMSVTRFKTGSTADAPVGITQSLTGKSFTTTGFTDGNTASWQVYFDTGIQYPASKKTVSFEFKLNSISSTSVQVGLGVGTLATASSIYQIAMNGAFVKATQQTATTVTGANASWAYAVGNTVKFIFERSDENSIYAYVVVKNAANPNGIATTKAYFTGLDLTGNLLITIRGAGSISSSITTSGNYSSTPPLAVNRLDWKYNNTDFVSTIGNDIVEQFTVVRNTQNNDGTGETMGDTGMSYNSDTDEFCISEYGYTTSARLIFYKREDFVPYITTGRTLPTPRRAIDLTSMIDHIQGNAWSKTENCYYVLGTLKGSTNNQRIMIHVNDAGQRVKPDWTPDIGFEPGMVAIRGNKMIISPNDQINAREYELLTKTFLRQLLKPASGEGVAYNELNGNIWIVPGVNMYEYTSNPYTQIGSYINGASNGEIEGVVIDRGDDSQWSAQDTWLHGVFNNGNIVTHHDVKHTYKKSIRFPEMYRWSTGTVSGGVSIVGDNLQGSGGYWESPVMDFGSYTDYLTNTPVATVNGKTVSFEYQGSNTVPSTPINTGMSVSIYPGWGSTAPSAYSTTKGNYRYQRIRMTIN